jgi:multiple sugar transport system substrate-binding protein
LIVLLCVSIVVLLFVGCTTATTTTAATTATETAATTATETAATTAAPTTTTESETKVGELGPTTSWIPDEDLSKWTQFKGQNIVLNFQGEDSPPAGAVIGMIDDFTNLTGITVEMTRIPLASLVQNLMLDFATQAGNIQVFHADPYQTTAPLAGHFTDLRKFMTDSTLPTIPLGQEDFTQMNWVGDAYMGKNGEVLSIPFSGCQYGLFYRKDVFEKYKSLFQTEMGYDWTPGPGITWDQYYEIASWINKKVKDGTITEVEYGAGAQAKMYDSLMCDFSNILASYGGDYFKGNKDIGTYGTDIPGACTLGAPEAIEAATFYKKLIDIEDPGSTGWDWGGLHDAFVAGRLALAPNFFDYAPWVEDPSTSKVAGKAGYTILPKGPTGKSQNIWGGYGLGINGYSSETDQKAAWLFLVWATSPAIQYEGLDKGYMPPTRTSIYNNPDLSKKLSPALVETMKAIEMAYVPENNYLRPKIPQWIECDTIIYTELSKMLAGNKSPEKAMLDAASQVDQATGWAAIAPKN